MLGNVFECNYVNGGYPKVSKCLVLDSDINLSLKGQLWEL